MKLETGRICGVYYEKSIQGSTNRRAPGFVNFVIALAYHICLNLPTAFTQPGACLLVEPCREDWTEPYKALWGMLYCMSFPQKYMHGCLAPRRNIFSLFATLIAWWMVMELGFPTLKL